MREKLAQVTKNMRVTNARNELLIHDLQKKTLQKTPQQCDKKHVSRVTQLDSNCYGLTEDQVRNVVSKVDDVTID